MVVSNGLRVLRDGLALSVFCVLIVGALTVGCAAAPDIPPVPGVEDARDVRDADPCTLSDAAALTGLGLAPAGEPGQAPEGPSCAWRGDGRALTVTLYAGGAGLATLAANSEPTTTRVRVAGYPALETFTGRGEFCQYDVGVAQDQVMMAALEGADPDSCTALQSVVGGLVAKLPSYPR